MVPRHLAELIRRQPARLKELSPEQSFLLGDLNFMTQVCVNGNGLALCHATEVLRVFVCSCRMMHGERVRVVGCGHLVWWSYT